MSYAVRFTDPSGARHYGVNPHDHHALHLPDRDKAEAWDTAAKASRAIALNVWCQNAFWQSERDHAARARREHRGWTVGVEDLATGNLVGKADRITT